ncbi:unnamed protein product [Durusdinium trenchii]|uniref:Uncharacterized protein n=1 Tax=Durusdinium trenchii TaxID=1381693 RepID=A0ABP0MYA9_9DINO
MQGEVQVLQHRVAEMDAALKEERRQKDEAQQAMASLEEHLKEAEAQQRQLERRLEEEKQHRNDSEETLRLAESKIASAERFAKASSEKAKEAELSCRARAEKEAMECRLKYAELGAARQKEMQAALLELQSLARGQELLRAELSRALRPLPPKPMGSYLAPPLRPLPSSVAYGSSPLRQAAQVTRSPSFQSPSTEELRRSLPFEPVSRSYLSPDLGSEHMTSPHGS